MLFIFLPLTCFTIEQLAIVNTRTTFLFIPTCTYSSKTTHLSEVIDLSAYKHTLFSYFVLLPWACCTLITLQGNIINPRRACAARVTVLGLCVCLSVCLSVDDYSRTTGYEAAYERYQQLQCYKGMKKMWRFC